MYRRWSTAQPWGLLCCRAALTSIGAEETRGLLRPQIDALKAENERVRAALSRAQQETHELTLEVRRLAQGPK